MKKCEKVKKVGKSILKLTELTSGGCKAGIGIKKFPEKKLRKPSAEVHSIRNLLSLSVIPDLVSWVPIGPEITQEPPSINYRRCPEAVLLPMHPDFAIDNYRRSSGVISWPMETQDFQILFDIAKTSLVLFQFLTIFNFS